MIISKSDCAISCQDSFAGLRYVCNEIEPGFRHCDAVTQTDPGWNKSAPSLCACENACSPGVHITGCAGPGTTAYACLQDGMGSDCVLSASGKYPDVDSCLSACNS